MTESRWLSSRTPLAMLDALKKWEADDRRVRLFVCACWRERVQQVSDPKGMTEEIEAVEANNYRGLKQGFFPTYADYWYAATATSEVHARWAQNDPAEPGVSAARQADILRDIFGNPFRPVAFAPEWRTDTAVTLARQMYDGYDFGAAPILADALQDAGCDSDDLLSHLRDTSAEHVRGCWVVDAALGRG